MFSFIKRMMLLVLAISILPGSTCLAVNHQFTPFTVTEPYAVYITNASKSDNEQRWYVTITSLYITSGDLLYFNVRDSVYGTRLSNALSFSTPTNKSTLYTTTVSQNQIIYLHSQLRSDTWTPDSFAYVASGRWCP